MTFASESSPAPAAPAPREEAPLYLVDGHSLTFKAYYAIRNLTAPDGMPTGAVYGFLRMLLRLIEDRRAVNLAVVFDTGKPTFREEIFPEYKAHREAPPEDFGQQMDWIYKLLAAMGIPVFQFEGYEADDLIATMAERTKREGREAVICSADKDLFQLVNGKTRMLRFGSKDIESFDEAAVENYLGIKPSQVADWLALVGDSSDNIPGVPTIGNKGAANLLQQFGSLENLLAHPDQLKNERQRKALIENAEQAKMSRKLATVVRDVPLDWSLGQCRLPESLWNARSVEILAQLGFNSLIKELGIKAPKVALANAPCANEEDFKIADDAADLREWVKQAASAEWLAVDTETTATDPMLAELVGISLSVREGEAIYIPVGHRVGETRPIALGELRAILSPLFGHENLMGQSPALTAHHVKYDWKILERAGFQMAAPKFDTMIASFVLDPGKNSGHGLKTLGAEICGIQMGQITEIIGEGKNAVTMADVPAQDVFIYACRDADVTLRLTRVFSDKLKEVPSLLRLFHGIEIPLIPVLHKMEVGGFAVEPSRLRDLSAVMSKEIERLGKEIWKAAGRQFNMDSPKQTAQLLFEDLKLPPGKKTKTGFSTDNDVLESLAREHPVARLLLEYRGLTKLKSTYADALPQQINPKTHRIHTSFNQTIAQTGRLSSTNPNLQNIPIRSELGKEIRRAFIPDSPAHKLLSADYSQIELRILAHFSGDKALTQAYAEGRDIHALTASRIFGVEQKDVTPQMRADAKIVNFGIIYGMSAHGLSQRLEIPRADAARFIESYFAGYPGVKTWIDATLAQARKDGYVETLMGRRRWLPDLNAKNGQLRFNAERIAVNTPIQGTSADMIKLAMIAIARGLSGVSPETRMVCQVHDELIFSVPRTRVEEVSEFVRKTMCEALPLKVPIVVDVSVGDNWAEC